jgi:hypothetical protein
VLGYDQQGNAAGIAAQKGYSIGLIG